MNFNRIRLILIRIFLPYLVACADVGDEASVCRQGQCQKLDGEVPIVDVINPQEIATSSGSVRLLSMQTHMSSGSLVKAYQNEFLFYQSMGPYPQFKTAKCAILLENNFAFHLVEITEDSIYIIKTGVQKYLYQYDKDDCHLLRFIPIAINETLLTFKIHGNYLFLSATDGLGIYSLVNNIMVQKIKTISRGQHSVSWSSVRDIAVSSDVIWILSGAKLWKIYLSSGRAEVLSFSNTILPQLTEPSRMSLDETLSLSLFYTGSQSSNQFQEYRFDIQRF